MDAAKLGRQFFVGDWLIEPAGDCMTRGAERVKLEPRTMRLLVRLALSPGEVVSADALLSEVWSGVVVGPASVYQAVSQLRRLLGDNEAQARYIATVSRKGYRLVAPVRPGPGPGPPPPVTDAAPVAATIDHSPQVAPLPRRRWIRASIAALILLLAGAVWYRATREPESPSIVVLPFVDMSAEKSEQSFCDGMTEELSNWLAQVPTLRVVARTSAFAFKGQSVDVRKIGEQLGITHVLEGSMRRDADHMRVTVQLIDARSGYHLWSTDYDRPMADAIKMQEDISRAVAGNLEIRLTRETAGRFSARGTNNAAAYRWYLVGLDLLQERRVEANQQAIALFQQSVAADPGFAPAYLGLGRAYLNERPLANVPVAELGPRIEPLLMTAEKLHPGMAETETLRGALRAEQGRIGAAETALRHAVQLNANDARAYAELGRILLTTGRPRQAVASWSRAIALDPLDFMARAQRCVSYQDLADFVHAAADCTRARELKPDAPWPYVASSWLSVSQGRLDEALKWNAEALRRSPDDTSLYTADADARLTLGLPAKGLERADALHPSAAQLAALNGRWASSAYSSGGAEALQKQLAARPLTLGADDTDTLLSAAYFDLLLGHPGDAARKAAQVRATPGFDAQGLLDPWFLRWGDSSALTMAIAARESGDEPQAQRVLGASLEALDKLIANGVERHAVYELRAGVLAMQGNPQRALEDLRHAARLGWRRTFWVQHEPQFEALWAREDFKALVAEAEAGNAAMRRAVAALP